MNTIYSLGKIAALTKLGMQLQFASPAEAAAHASTKQTIGKVTGFAGDIVGGTIGAGLGAPGGPAGTIAGSAAGGYLGNKLLSAPATTAYDALHDIPQKAKASYGNTLQRLNAAAGLPTGVRV